MIANFVLTICGCRPSWTMEQYVAEQLAKVRDQVGDGSVFLLASGGVDSTVAAKVIGQAVGPDRLHLLHIDNGLMRKDESRQVVDALRAMGLDRNLHFVDASDTFLAALDGLVEPEAKRKAIGDTFIEVFEREARRLGIERAPAGPGDDLPRHHRDGRHEARRHHQDAPQPRADHHRDDRAGAGRRAARRPVQGGGARARREAGRARRHALAPPVPGPGPRRPPAVLDRRGRTGEGLDAIAPAIAEVGRRYWPGGRAAADPLGGREGRPARLRAPGRRGRRGRLGPAARGGGHDLQERRRHQPRASGASGRAAPARSARSPRPSRARAWTCCARPTRASPRRCGGTGSTTRSGSARPCSCRSRSTAGAASW